MKIFQNYFALLNTLSPVKLVSTKQHYMFFSIFYKHELPIVSNGVGTHVSLHIPMCNILGFMSIAWEWQPLPTQHIYATFFYFAWIPVFYYYQSMHSFTSRISKIFKIIFFKHILIYSFWCFLLTIHWKNCAIGI